MQTTKRDKDSKTSSRGISLLEIVQEDVNLARKSGTILLILQDLATSNQCSIKERIFKNLTDYYIY